MLDRIKNEPILIYALVQSLLILGVRFGLEITDEQTAAILDVTSAVLAIVLGVVARGFVTPKRSKTPASAGLNAMFLLLMIAALSLTACAGTFEEARLVQPERPVAAAREAGRCTELDDQHRLWGAVGKGSAVLAGASGLATIPIDSREGEIGLAAGAVGTAALAATAVYLSESAAESYVRECTE